MLRLDELRNFVQIALVSVILIMPIYSLQLGNGNHNGSSEFLHVADNAKAVFAMDFATFIIKEDDSLWGTGQGIYTRFGMKGDSAVHSFVKIMDGVKQVSSRFLVKTDGTLWSTGGKFTLVDHGVKKASGCLYVKDDGTLWAYGTDRHGCFGTGQVCADFTEPVLLMSDVENVYSDDYRTQVITRSHELLVSGELWLPEPYEKTTSFYRLADGIRDSDDGFYITDSNSLYVFGFGGEGALGLADLQKRVLPTKIMDDVSSVRSNQQVSLILTSQGWVYGCGGATPNYCGELGFGDRSPVLTPRRIAGDVVAIAVGACHTAILKNDGSVWTCGANDIPALQ